MKKNNKYKNVFIFINLIKNLIIYFTNKTTYKKVFIFSLHTSMISLFFYRKQEIVLNFLLDTYKKKKKNFLFLSLHFLL